MGWFTRKPKTRTVSVSFRALTSTTPADPAHAYTYLWTLPVDPIAGSRVIVPGGDGRDAPAVIAAVDVMPPSGVTLKSVTRTVTNAEIAAAYVAKQADEDDWLEMSRKAAGLPSSTRRRKVPEGYPEIAPAEGNATSTQAAEYGRMWWRAYKRAEERGRPTDEIKRYSEIAHRWYAIRDRKTGEP